MRVERVMSAAKCCREDDTVRDVARLMKDENIGFVPICNANDEPVGALTDRDLVIRVIADGRSMDERAGACMTRGVAGVRIGDDVKEAIRCMREERRSRVMVCDDQGKLRGVVSLADVADTTSEEEAGETLQEVKSDQPAAH
jgi:CBS domain-containing protein